MRKIKHLFYILSMLFIALQSSAVPTWSVQESQYSNSMTITGIISISGKELLSSNDIVAAFVGTECRGIAHLYPSAILGHAYAYLVINSNTSGEIVQFKIFKSSTETIITVPDTKTFVADGTIGTQDNPYVFSDKVVNGSVIQAASFGVAGEIVTIDSTLKTISVNVPLGTNITALSPLIKSSAGSQLSINGAEIPSTLNLSTTQIITVTAQNGTQVNWTISTTIQTSLNEMNTNFEVQIEHDGDIVFRNFPENAVYSIFSMTGQCLISSKMVQDKSSLHALPKASYVVVICNSMNQHIYSKLLIW